MSTIREPSFRLPVIPPPEPCDTDQSAFHCMPVSRCSSWGYTIYLNRECSQIAVDEHSSNNTRADEAELVPKAVAQEPSVYDVVEGQERCRRSD